MPSLPVYLSGVSMGASTVLMATELDLPSQVKGVIADCGFTTPYEMVGIFAKNMMHMKNLSIVDSVNELCKKKAGYDFKECSTLDAMKKCRIPIFFALFYQNNKSCKGMHQSKIKMHPLNSEMHQNFRINKMSEPKCTQSQKNAPAYLFSEEMCYCIDVHVCRHFVIVNSLFLSVLLCWDAYILM